MFYSLMGKCDCPLQVVICYTEVAFTDSDLLYRSYLEGRVHCILF